MADLAADGDVPPRVEDVVDLSSGDIETQVVAICRRLLGKADSAWREAPDADFEVKVITGGLTNLLYKVSLCCPAADPPTVLVRAFGKAGDAVCDRSMENKVFQDLSKAGFGPRLFGLFGNGRLEGWLEGRRPLEALEMLQCSEPDFMCMIARKTAELHARIVPTSIGDMTKVDLWDQIQQWANLAREVSFPDDPVKAGKLAQLDLPAVLAEIEHCQRLLPSRLNSDGEALLAAAGPLESAAHRARRLLYEKRFCHMDLLSGNIMFSQEAGDVRLIDFEYAAVCYIGVDVANHFNAVPESYFNAGNRFEPETWYPSSLQQLNWLSAYMKERSLVDLELDRELGEALLQVVAQFALVAELRWVIWAVVQAGYSPVDFDYLEYATMRFRAYFLYRKWQETGRRDQDHREDLLH
ncbi:unnamed protein product [Polarella glacialis]|uniref:ethanolamine kinase n=1 Tax=Polarella glacialis TaxID=89957 RepID=A0A813IQZ4_POLGL|nr:unnamed protein product [Polarella glacialis]CAE8668485.1 unnamed protein product [Polarella glacialis]